MKDSTPEGKLKAMLRRPPLEAVMKRIKETKKVKTLMGFEVRQLNKHKQYHEEQ